MVTGDTSEETALVRDPPGLHVEPVPEPTAQPWLFWVLAGFGVLWFADRLLGRRSRRNPRWEDDEEEEDEENEQTPHQSFR